MNIGAKIRFLLLILGICCLVTALSLKHSITRKDLLRHEGARLQENLALNERIVYGFLADMKQLSKARQFHHNEAYALDYLVNYKPKGINVLTYENNVLQFWSSYKAIPLDPDKIKEGSSFVQFPNGWYEVIRKTEGNFTVMFLIDVKNQFSIQNRYLKNGIVKNLSKTNALTLASFIDEEVYGITNLDGKLLFEVKLDPNYSKGIYASIQIWLWVVGLFCFALFTNSCCAWLVKKGHLWKGTLLLIFFFVAFRITDLQYLSLIHI